MSFKERVGKALSKLFPGRFEKPEIPQLPAESSDSERKDSRRRHEEYLKEIAQLPNHEKGIDYALYRLAGHINDFLPVYRNAAVSALKEVGRMIAADKKRRNNRAQELLRQHLSTEDNTTIKAKIVQALEYIDHLERSR